jgi:ATP-dependent exoDNAse (exonuclease V) alpha subunit
MTQQEALDILKTGANVFLTGEPGAGKTYTINEYVRYLRQHSIEPAITASTGIASTHIHGMTIHSWAGIGIRDTLTEYDLDHISQNKTLYNRISKTKVLIIDEISMLSARTFSMVDMVCRVIKGVSDPFGGIQVVCVGDFFQLPPVSRATREQFAFESKVWNEIHFITCYLDSQHRQDDRTYLSILDAIRRDEFNEDHLETLGDRRITRETMPENITKLFPHNVDVDKINTGELKKIDAPEQMFVMTSKGRDILVAALKKSCLSPEHLVIKLGATVMFTKNNSNENYVNGTLATVIAFDPLTSNPIVETVTGRKITVMPMEWSIEEEGRVKAQITQLPLRLAWAITVHKSQGMTLDKAIMDLSLSFEYGQGYVALSRVKSLAGLHILGWNQIAFKVHPTIIDKDEYFRNNSLEAETKFGALESDDLEQMHNNFILASGGKLERKEVDKTTNKAVKVSTHEETLKLFKSGKTFREIATARGMVIGTILQHIEDLKEEEKITFDEIKTNCDKETIKRSKVIQKLFDKLGTSPMKPIFEKLGGKYSYDDIRIARLLYNQ